MTREELLDSNHRQSRSENFRQAKVDSADSLCQKLPEEASGGAATLMMQTDLVLVPPIFSVYALLPAVVPA